MTAQLRVSFLLVGLLLITPLKTAVLLDAYAQAKMVLPPNAKLIGLTDAEIREASTANHALMVLNQELEQRWLNVLTTDISGDCAKANDVVYSAKLTYAKQQSAAVQLDRIRERLTAAHDCKGCVFTPDFKSLALPESAH